MFRYFPSNLELRAGDASPSGSNDAVERFLFLVFAMFFLLPLAYVLALYLFY